MPKQAYADYYDVMDLTEELVAGLVHAVKGSHKIQYHASAHAAHLSPDNGTLPDTRSSCKRERKSSSQPSRVRCSA